MSTPAQRIVESMEQRLTPADQVIYRWRFRDVEPSDDTAGRKSFLRHLLSVEIQSLPAQVRWARLVEEQDTIGELLGIAECPHPLGDGTNLACDQDTDALASHECEKSRYKREFDAAVAHPRPTHGEPVPRRDAAPDPWGTPERWRSVAQLLRTAGQAMTTGDLRRRGYDMGQLMAESKGCSAADKAWAQRHLRAGRGRWHWKPPMLPAEKGSPKEAR